MRIKSIKNGQEQNLIINAPEIRVVDIAEQFESNDVEGALKELALGQGNIGGTALEDIEQLKADKTSLLTKVGDVTQLPTTDKTSVVNSIKEVNSHLSEMENEVSNLSNPNLLINGDFQIWQRGRNFNTPTREFTADRWYFVDDGSNYEVSKSNGLKLNVSKFSGTYVNMEYHLDLDLYEKIKGKQVTISIKLKNNSLINAIGLRAYPDNSNRIINKIAKDYYVYTTTIPICSTECTRFMLYIQKLEVGVLDIEYIKLELGSVATPFVPRSYGEELALCQRYYQKLIRGFAYSSCYYSTDGLDFVVPLSTPMRVKPTINIPTFITVRNNDTGLNDNTFTTPSVSVITDGVLNVRVIKKAHGIKNASCWLDSNGDNGSLDSEIY